MRLESFFFCFLPTGARWDRFGLVILGDYFAYGFRINNFIDRDSARRAEKVYSM